MFFTTIKLAQSAVIISTVAGGGTNYDDGVAATTASLMGLSSATLDTSGNIYLSEFAKIRKISTNKVITTVAGTGAQCSNFMFFFLNNKYQYKFSI